MTVFGHLLVEHHGSQGLGTQVAATKHGDALLRKLMRYGSTAANGRGMNRKTALRSNGKRGRDTASHVFCPLTRTCRTFLNGSRSTVPLTEALRWSTMTKRKVEMRENVANSIAVKLV